MDKTDPKYKSYLKILHEELVPAMGCTEPIAIAYAAAVAREALGAIPDRCELRVSGNIIKNAKSVVVPGTGGLKGIPAALAAGVIAGRASMVLEVLSDVPDESKEAIKAFVNACPIRILPDDSGSAFYLQVDLHKDESCAKVLILNYHTNIVLIERNGRIVFQAGSDRQDAVAGLTDRSILNVSDIVDFADSVVIDDIRDVIERQIRCNTAIAEEGLRNPWGAGIGKVLQDTYGDTPMIRARAAAAAASDARMGGCEMPVIIVSGSGNQGITASLPVITFAGDMASDSDRLYRALVVANLVTIHQKTGIGRLSAFCGAVSAGVGAGAGIAYLSGGGYPEIAHTIVNALAVSAGIVCDGAKPSCAAKIALAVESGLLGYFMYAHGQEFKDGEGIITKGVENTIANIGRLARDGMKETDREILRIMVGD